MKQLTSASSFRTQVERQFPGGARGIERMVRQLILDISRLDQRVDAAYEYGNPQAEDLDAELAELRERLIAIAAEYEEMEEDVDLEEPEYHEGVGMEEQLAHAYAHHLLGTKSAPFAGSHSNVLMHMRAVLEEAGPMRLNVTDEQILAAAADVYQAFAQRYQRRTRTATQKATVFGRS